MPSPLEYPCDSTQLSVAYDDTSGMSASNAKPEMSGMSASNAKPEMSGISVS